MCISHIQLKRAIVQQDLNPIEHTWQLLDAKLRASSVKLTSEADMMEKLQAAWSQTTTAETQNLISSMGRRCQAVIDANGGPTKLMFLMVLTCPI